MNVCLHMDYACFTNGHPEDTNLLPDVPNRACGALFLMPTDVLKQILIPYITGSCDPVYVAEFAGRHKVRPPDTIDQMR